MAISTLNDGWRALVDRFWDDVLELEPIIATEVGDERFDDRLPDPSPEGRTRREEIHRRALADLAGIDRSGLDMIARTTLDVAEAIARRELASLEHRMDRLGAVSHMWGPGTLLADLGSLQRADTAERRDRYYVRLTGVPAYLDAVTGLIDEAVRAHRTAPAVVVDRSIGQVERLIQLPPDASPALKPLSNGADRDRFVDLVRDVLWPAYARYRDALRDYRPHARDSIGVCAFPEGEDLYTSEIRSWTTLPLSAAEVHEMGTRVLESIQMERKAIVRGLGYDSPAEAIEAHQSSGRNTAPSRDEMVRIAEGQVTRGWEVAPRYFGVMPHANCQVWPVEEYREADMPFAFYQGPTEDGERPGVYYVNTSNLDERPLHHLASTTYHEANPGHHFQVSIEQEIGDRPALRRFGGILAGSAFIEGWALYCERLADEMGLYQSEFERLGMLDAQAFRAARLTVDSGIHAFGWDRDRAIAAMMETGAQRLDSTIEVDRYIALPGQALSYMIGQLQIQGWRKEAEARDGFSLRDFHDHLLSLGSLPLQALARELEGDGAASS